MKNNDWDPEDFQGKSQKQVEASYKIIGWAISGMVIFSVMCYIASFVFDL
jgi:hypothetical protein